MEMFGGVSVTPEVQTPRASPSSGCETIAPIMRRGVLLDVASAKGVDVLPQGYLVTEADLVDRPRRRTSRSAPGDCVLVRTGNGRQYGDPETYLAGRESARRRTLAGRARGRCSAARTTSPSTSPDHVDPELGSLPCHDVLIYEAGIYIVENLNLEELAASGTSTGSSSSACL